MEIKRPERKIFLAIIGLLQVCGARNEIHCSKHSEKLEY